MLLRRTLIIGMLFALMLCQCVIPAAAAEEIAQLEQDILDACTYRETVQLSPHDISVSDFEALFDRMYYAGQLPWYSEQGYKYSYNEDTNKIVSFTPATLYDGALDMEAYEQQVASILQACVLPGMTQWQIALSIHDYLIANTRYDESLEKNSSYDLLTAGTAVCAGYALAYQDLLLRAGIDCRYIVSEEMEHAWNLVCIDGAWYHVDLTWDDAAPDLAGRVSHTYFLRTDQEFSTGDEPHYGWQTDITCTDTRFSDAFWVGVEGAICYESSETCYVMRSDDFTSHIYRRQGDRETLLYKESKNSIDLGYGRYKYEHTGLSLRNGRLYFNTLNKVLSMKTDGSDSKTEYSHGGNTYIFGCHADTDTLHMSFMTHDGDNTYKSLPLTTDPGHVHRFTVTVQEPTCTAKGYTESVCICGLSCESAPVKATGHTPVCVYEKEASLFQSGFGKYTCQACGESYTETYPQLTLTGFIKEHIPLTTGSAVLLVLLLRRIFVHIKKRKS